MKSSVFKQCRSYILYLRLTTRDSLLSNIERIRDMLSNYKEPKPRSSSIPDLVAFDDFTSQLNNGRGTTYTLEWPLRREDIVKLPAPSLHGFVYEMSLGMRWKRELRFFNTETNEGVYETLCIFSRDSDFKVMDKYFFTTTMFDKRVSNKRITELDVECLYQNHRFPIVIWNFMRGFSMEIFRNTTDRSNCDSLLKAFLDQRAATGIVRLPFRMFIDYTTGTATWEEWRDFICWCRDKNKIVEDQRLVELRG